MCGRATVINPDGITEKLYGYTRKFVPSDWKPRYNLNPHEDIPAVYYDPFLKERVLRTMHWNLIPSKLEGRDSVVSFDSQYSTFNARIETVASAPTFQQSWRSQRCLVVVDGIIEWVGEKKRKVPHLIRHKDRIPFAMAGLWSRWHDRADGEELWSCTVIVKDADEWYSQFNNRMAVQLSTETY
jgi:putative SOS response-associated peptidase YedK